MSSKKPAVVAIDASGIKVYGEGAWKVKIHCKSKRRKWLKIHSAVDHEAGEAVAETTTESSVADSRAAESLLTQLPLLVKEFLAYGTYDDSGCRKMIKNRGAQTKILPPKNAHIRNRDTDLDEAIKHLAPYGGSLSAIIKELLWKLCAQG